MEEVDQWIEQLKQGERLPERAVSRLCDAAQAIFDKEPNVVSVSAPATLIGDIHGQWYDMMEIFKLAGWPPENKLVFLGDYVDRGYYSVECVSLVLALKVRHPGAVTVLRGNHECRQVTQVYGFYDECLRKYNTPRVWKRFVDLFDFLPLAALVDSALFAVHGGLAQAVATVDALEPLQRRVEIPQEGALCDLIWSDPDDREGWGVSPRGAGITFGPAITQNWNHVNGLDLLVMEGFQWTHGGALLTLFSAPNYSYRCGNRAAIMEVPAVARDRYKVLTFDAAVRPTDGPTPAKRTPDYFL